MKSALRKFLFVSSLVTMLSGCGSEVISSSFDTSSSNTSISSSISSSIISSSNSSVSSSSSSSLSASSSSSSPSSSSVSSKSSSSSKISSPSSSSSSNKSTSSVSSIGVDHTGCGHLNEQHINTPATCQINGVDTYICLTCGKKVKAERKDKLSHDYSYEVVTSSYFRTQIKKMCTICGSTSSSNENVNKANNKVAYKTADTVVSNNAVGYVVTTNNGLKAVPTLGYEFVAWSDGTTTREISQNNGNLTAIFKHKTSELPILSINLANNVTLANVKRDEYKTATFECENCTDNATLTGTFKGRGNGSWVGSSGKSGYTFKLDSKKKIFGMDSKSKKWNIIANKDDDSQHINYAAYNMARDALPGIEWQAQTKYVEVYINYEFRGVYMLTDAVKVENSRIPAVSEDANGDYTYESSNPGFLVEYDRYATSNSSDTPSDPSGDLDPIENMSYFKVNNLYREFSVKYPDPDDAKQYGGTIENSRHKAAVLTIKSIMQNFANILTSGTYEQLTEIVDIQSMMDMYLLHELFKNSDVGWSSFYIYKKPNDNKLHFGPAWDFDLAAYKSRTNETSGIHIASKTYSGNPTNNTSSSYNDIFIKATKLKNTSSQTQFANDLNIRFTSLKENVIKSFASTVGGNDNKTFGFALNCCKWANSSGGYMGQTQSIQYSVAVLKVLDWLADRTCWMLNNNFVK